jgi:hypothetical protein
MNAVSAAAVHTITDICRAHRTASFTDNARAKALRRQMKEQAQLQFEIGGYVTIVIVNEDGNSWYGLA